MSRPAPSLFNQPIGDDRCWLEKTIRRARANASELSDREIQFVDDTMLRLDRYGADTFVSEKQRAWLQRIEKRLDEAGVPADPDDTGDSIARPVDPGSGSKPGGAMR